MDWYSPGRPIIGKYCAGYKYNDLKAFARAQVHELNGIFIFLKKAQDLYGDTYKNYEYEIMEIFQDAIELMYIRHEGVFKK